MGSTEVRSKQLLAELFAGLGEFEKADELLEQSIKELEKRLDELPAVTQKKVEETDAGRRLF